MVSGKGIGDGGSVAGCLFFLVFPRERLFFFPPLIKCLLDAKCSTVFFKKDRWLKSYPEVCFSAPWISSACVNLAIQNISIQENSKSL